MSLVAALEKGRATYPGFPLPHLAGNAALGLLAVLAAIPLSVRLGQRRPPVTFERVVVVAANVALALYLVVLVGRVHRSTVTYLLPDTTANRTTGPDGGVCLADSPGRNITDLYAFGTNGALQNPVLLYDQDGRSINNLCPEVDDQGRFLRTVYAADSNGSPVSNAFPVANCRVDSWGGGFARDPAGGRRPPGLGLHDGFEHHHGAGNTGHRRRCGFPVTKPGLGPPTPGTARPGDRSESWGLPSCG